MRVFLRTYGCRANQYDTEAVRAMIAAEGVDEVTDFADAEVAIFNSCTVTAAAEADLRADVRAAVRANRNIRAVIMGCAPGVTARDESVAPLRTLPGVDALVAGADLATLAAALGLRNAAPAAGTLSQTSARALLRIQDGCDEHCTFCAATLARGANRSRPVDVIVAEALALSSVHPEIVLTGVHIGTYGRDIGESVASLVEKLISDVPRVRFRLTSVEATEVDEKLGELLTADPSRLAPHLHAPLQSGSDSVLRRMGRSWYDAASYEASVMRIAAKVGTFALSADVITGFPGETAADHEQTVELVKRLPFTSLHVFPYSPRPGTAALRLHSRVAPAIARKRAAELRRIADEKAFAYRASRVGGSCDVVVTERGKGLTEDYLSVAVPDSTIPRRTRYTGRLSQSDDVLIATASDTE